MSPELEHSGLSYPVRVFGLDSLEHNFWANDMTSIRDAENLPLDKTSIDLMNFRLEIIFQPSAVISGNENDEYCSTGTDLEQ